MDKQHFGHAYRKRAANETSLVCTVLYRGADFSLTNPEGGFVIIIVDRAPRLNGPGGASINDKSYNSVACERNTENMILSAPNPRINTVV